MKKSHLKQFIKEEIRSVLKESVNEGDNWKTVKTKSGDTLKPGKKYTMPRYDGEITFIRFDRDNKTMHLKSNKIGKIRTSIDNAKDMVLVESINEITSSQAIEAGKDLIPIIKKWTAKDEDYLSFAYDKWQELLVKKYKIDPLVAIDIRNHLYSIQNRHNLDRLHNVAYGVIINLTESINEELYYTFNKNHSNIGENPQFKEDVIRRVKEHPHMMDWADDDIINKVIKSAEEFYAFKEKGHGGLVPRNRTMSSEEFADAVIAELT